MRTVSNAVKVDFLAHFDEMSEGWGFIEPANLALAAPDDRTCLGCDVAEFPSSRHQAGAKMIGNISDDFHRRSALIYTLSDLVRWKQEFRSERVGFALRSRLALFPTFNYTRRARRLLIPMKDVVTNFVSDRKTSPAP